MPVQNPEDTEQVLATMEQLYQSSEFTELLYKINKVIDDIKEVECPKLIESDRGVFEALIFAVTFAILIVSILSFNHKK